MRKLLLLLTCLLSLSMLSQQSETNSNSSDFIITPEIMVGVTADSNSNFPEHGLQKQLMVSFGWEHDNNPNEWAQRLKGPRTGVGIGFEDFGNLDSLGIGITLMPFFEFNTFRRKNLKVQIGMGATYFNKQYDPVLNPNNQAVTTDLTWAFRLFMHYQVLSTKKIDWRLGGGFFHHSNGHTRLLNQGYNSFLVSLSADIKNTKRNKDTTPTTALFDKSTYSYLMVRSGYGINVLGQAGPFNDKKGVYTLSGEYGKVINKTFKIGIGFYYRFYQHYYDYIADNESLVQEGREYEAFKESPGWNASNLGISLNGEVLLNHIGLDLQLGFNIHKPSYEIEWKMNQGWMNTPREIPESWMLGELDSKYKLKRLISGRLGLKYYLIGTQESPKNNLYFGVYLNSNLGQADFSEVSLGYVHSFNFKKSS